MSILGGFARRPNVNGLSPWVYYTEVYVRRAKTTARYPLRSTIQVALTKTTTVLHHHQRVSCRASVHAAAGRVAILAAKADQSVKYCDRGRYWSTC